ncbi:MAG: prolipoprotein diacylglyceryl transferase family protein [Candidatus Zixiibacteriota bacterium]
MFPDPVNIGPCYLDINAIPLALGFIISLLIAIGRGRKHELRAADICSIFILVLISGIIGAKLFYAVFHWSRVSSDWIKFGRARLTGSGVFGAIILSAVTALSYMKWRSLHIMRTLDILAPSIAIVFGFGRIGCFFSGCCYGLPTDNSIGIIFPTASPAGMAFPGQPLVPTQLVQAFDAFVIALVLLYIDRIKPFYGFTFCILFFLYGLDRFVIDFYRSYEKEQIMTTIYGYPVPVTQLMALILIIGIVIIALYLKKKGGAFKKI